MRLLQALICVILVLEMCLLGMMLAQWRKTGDIAMVIEQNFDSLFYFLKKYVIIFK